MSDVRVRDLPSGNDAPPPGAELERLLGDLRPIVPRRPLVGLLVVLAAGGALVAGWAAMMSWRADLPRLPMWWLVAGGVLWGASWLGVLATALLPHRGQVMLDGPRALRAAALATIVLALWSGLFPSVGIDRTSAGVLPDAWHCDRFAFLFWLATLLAALHSLRWVALVGTWQIGAAIGLGAGSLAGFVLHYSCPIGGAAHALLGHLGGAVLSALVSALTARWLFGQAR